MASTEVQICNKALARIGVSKFIEALTDQSTEAEACNQLYSACRDEVLAAFWWRFATRQATLAQLSGVSRTGWAYAYGLPADCLDARYVVLSGNRKPRASDRVPFELQAADDLAGRILLCDESAVVLAYTAKVTNPTAFPPLFVSTLAYLLASELATALKAKRDLADRALQLYGAELGRAQASELRQGQDDADPDSDFVSARG